MMNKKTYLIKSTINNILNLIVTIQKSGSDLISNKELSKQFNVSRTTIIEAISYLCEKQIIERKKWENYITFASRY